MAEMVSRGMTSFADDLDDAVPGGNNNNKKNQKESISSIGDMLIKAYHLKTLSDTRLMAYYNEEQDVYIEGDEAEDLVRHAVRQQIDRDIENSDMNEILMYIRDMTKTKRSEFDGDPDWLHVGNGWVNIRTKETREPSPEYLSFAKLPWKFDPEAKNPQQLEFFDDLLEEDDLPVCQKMFGYFLVNDNRYKKAFMAIGPKDTGKSKFQELVETFVGGGKNVSHVSLHDMDRYAHNVVEITKSIVNTSSEVSKYKLRDVTIFKRITGGDESSFRAIYGRPFDAKPRAKILVVTNDKPNFDDVEDRTFIERWVVFKFLNVFTSGEDMDIKIMEKLTTEMSGLMNYAIEGLAMLENDGYFKLEVWEDVQQDWMELEDGTKFGEYVGLYCVNHCRGPVPGL
jgi:P4 family phage/plasmid primase-like protien